jgi:hypothetical protein
VSLSFVKSHNLPNYDLILNYLNHCRTLHSRRHRYVLFLINISKGKINCLSIMNTVGIRVPTRQIREFPTFSVSTVLRHSPSDRCVIVANDMQNFFTFLAKPYLL